MPVAIVSGPACVNPALGRSDFPPWNWSLVGIIDDANTRANGINMARIKACGFLIYRNEPTKSFLLMQHVDRWDLPKGHLDPGETKIECAYRELEEETGIKRDDILVDEHFRFKHKYQVKGKRYGAKDLQKKKLIIYLAELIHPVDIHITEHAGYQWFDWNPPHNIQLKTINPLLEQLAEYWASPLGEDRQSECREAVPLYPPVRETS